MPDLLAVRGRTPYSRTKIFINYRREDTRGDAERLYDELKKYFPARHLFLDVKSIREGDDYSRAIETALDSCDAFLVLIGPRWLVAADERGQRRLDDPSDMVRREVSAALSKGKWVIPVLLHRASMPEAKDLPEDLKRLALCHATEIRSGHWESDVRELVALLKRRLYRRRRLAAALLFAAALVVVAALSLYLATVPLPVRLTPGGTVNLPKVVYQPVEENAQARQGGAGPQELVIAGLAGGEVYRFDGYPLANVRADFDSARFQEETVNSLKLNPDLGKSWEPAKYSWGREDATPKLDFKQACPTSIIVTAPTATAADGSASSFSLRLFQQDEPVPDEARAISLSADRDLTVNFNLKTSVRPVNSAGCSKQITLGVEPVPCIGCDAGFEAQAGTPFHFQFASMDPERASERTDLFRPEADTNLDIPLQLRASRVTVRARGGEEVPCGNTLGRTPTTSFEASSADGQSSLNLRRLEVGANYFILAAEGDAYVVDGCHHVSPGVVERVGTHLPLTVLLLTSAGLSLAGLAYFVVKL